MNFTFYSIPYKKSSSQVGALGSIVFTDPTWHKSGLLGPDLSVLPVACFAISVPATHPTRLRATQLPQCTLAPSARTIPTPWKSAALPCQLINFLPLQGFQMLSPGALPEAASFGPFLGCSPAPAQASRGTSGYFRRCAISFLCWPCLGSVPNGQCCILFTSEALVPNTVTPCSFS